MKSLILRSGVLRSPIEGKFDFIHNAFKEYFCAKAVSYGDRFGFLHSMLGHEAWREVAVLAAAITDERKRADFIGNVLKSGDEDAESKVMYHLLAVTCLETCTQLDESIQKEIRKRLKGLRPPETVSEARALSAAGELALPLLKKRAGAQYATTAAACVRALRLIGTPAALQVLEQYGDDRRATVVKELLAAWRFFDRDEYARKVLAKSHGVRGHLQLSAGTVEFAHYFTLINSLTMFLPEQISSNQYGSISSLSNLRSLLMQCDGSIDISRLAPLQYLEHLRLIATDLEGAATVGSFEKLMNLVLVAKAHLGLNEGTIGREVKDLVVTSPNLTITKETFKDVAIRSASLGRLDDLEDGAFLQNMASLVRLKLAGSNLELIIKSAELPNLQVLQLNPSPSLNDLTSLSHLTSVQHLQISGAVSLCSLDGLQNLETLSSLSLMGTNNLMNIDALAKAKNLVRIYVSAHPDANLSVLRDISSKVDIYASVRVMQRLQEMEVPARRGPTRLFASRQRPFAYKPAAEVG